MLGGLMEIMLPLSKKNPSIAQMVPGAMGAAVGDIIGQAEKARSGPRGM